MPKPKMEDRAYQLDCLRALKFAFKGGCDKGLFVLATGLGKTYTAIQFVRWALRQARLRRRGRSPRVLVLCHQNTILTQLRDEFLTHLGDRFTYGVFNSVEERPDGDVDFLFATFQTMTTARDSFGRDYFDFLLVDEGHHSAAESFAETILFFQTVFRLAMTATPNRMDMKDIRVLFGKELYSKRLVEALAERLVPRVRYKVFLERRERLADLLKDRKPSKRIIEDEYFRADPSEARDEEVADIIARYHREQGSPQLLVFCQDITHCERFVGLLAARGIASASVHSDHGHDENERRIARFKGGSLPSLVARDILNEGKDLPAVRLIAAVRTTGSLTIFEQQIGRGLRPGKPELTFLDFVANCERMTLISQVVNDATLMHQEWLAAQRPAGNAAGDGGGGGAGADGKDDGPIVVESGDVSFVEELRELTGILGDLNEPWTRGSAIEGIRKLAAHLGRDTLSYSDLQQGSRQGFCPSTRWLVLNFDPNKSSAIPALEAAGLSAVGNREWTRETALEGLRSLAEQLGRSELSYDDLQNGSKEGICPSYTWLVQEFDPAKKSYIPAVEAAGLSARSTNWTRENAMEALRSLAERLGRPGLSPRDLGDASKEGTCPGRRWLIREFDPQGKSHIPALEAAGLKAARKRRIKWTREKAIEALRSFAERLGRTELSQQDLENASKEGICPSYSWLAGEFDPEGRSYLPALEAAGLRPMGRTRLNRPAEEKAEPF